MSLAFLSKKTFHPTNFNNQEAVWKAEQAEAEEQRKLEEWKSKREEERQSLLNAGLYTPDDAVICELDRRISALLPVE